MHAIIGLMLLLSIIVIIVIGFVGVLLLKSKNTNPKIKKYFGILGILIVLAIIALFISVLYGLSKSGS